MRETSQSAFEHVITVERERFAVNGYRDMRARFGVPCRKNGWIIAMNGSTVTLAFLKENDAILAKLTVS